MSEQARPVPSKRDVERALVAAGLSTRQAKKLLARGYRAISVDVDEDAEELVEMAEQLTRRLRSRA